MTSRAVFLPAKGDPFLLHLWMMLYNRDWIDEVDRVYVSVDQKSLTREEHDPHAEWMSTDDFVIDFLEQNKKVTAIRNHDVGISGNYINIFNHCKSCKEKYIAIIQEDAFVFEKGTINRQFERIEQGIVDVVGTPMMCYTPSFNKQLGPLFGKESLFLMDHGYSLWQNFLFMKQSDIIQLDIAGSDIYPHTWWKGVKIDILGITPEEDVDVDVLVPPILHFRKQGKRIGLVPQILAYTNHLDYLESQLGPSGLWERVEGWCHVTCLSSIIAICIDKDLSLLNLPEGSWEAINNRVKWWLMCWEMYHDRCTEIKEFSDYYKLAIDTAIKNCHIDQGVLRSDINKLKNMLKI